MRIALLGFLVSLSLWTLSPQIAQAMTKTSPTRSPVLFIENQGQIDSRVDYYVAGKDKSLYFDALGATFSLLPASRQDAFEMPDLLEQSLSLGMDALLSEDASFRWNVRVDFVNSNPEVKAVGRNAAPTTISYFKGSRTNWKTGLKTYSSLAYPDLWHGIDLVYAAEKDGLEYRFLVQPGADPQKIRMAYSGAKKVVSERGDRLTIETPVGGFEEGSLYVYQERNGKRETVAANFVVEEGPEQSVVGFNLGAYDRTRPLIIDPEVLVYAGFIGGSGADAGTDIAVDTSGNAYVTGYTESDASTFPAMTGPDTTANGSFSYDAFIAKVAPDGASLVYAGFIGGAGND